MTLSLIIACIIIFVILIVVPLVLSKKAEDNSKIINEWDKIKEYGKKINEKTKNKKN
jgi:NADH:ubiquinone oxidoreductase subunit 6 (subunit J)|tara:strand:+ start:46 stop:216 length:171 start_codon:yes stop_codon:yes gene_type:complete